MDIRPGKLALSTTLVVALGAPLLAQSGSTTDRAMRVEASATAPVPATGSVQTGHDSHYVIGSDDVLNVNVWKEPDLTEANIPVRSDGNISVPLIGEVHASGLTPLQLEREISTKLRAYLTAPDVTVVVVQMNSQKFNILGRVMKPGTYKLTAAITILDAIAQAGGFQDFAKKKNIYILRQDPQGKEMRIPFNYKSVIGGGHPEQNIRLAPHDTIVVP
jgi:polysaccharide export outer membrane protein